MTPLCAVVDGTCNFGAVAALDGVSFAVEAGDRIGVIGPNGSGKTTLFNCMSGRIRMTRGSVAFRDEAITGKSMHEIAQRGLVRTFQEPKFFSSGLVGENVSMAIAIARRAHARRLASREHATTEALLALCQLDGVADRPASSLPHGQLRKLGIALALAAGPDLLLLDEPAAGLNDAESQQLASLLLRVHASGVTMMIVDHDMPFLMPLVERLIVLSAGRVIADGPPDDVRRDPRVIEVYLGTGISRPSGGRPAGTSVSV